MADNQPVRRIFSPRLSTSVGFAITSIVVTIAIYAVLNCVLQGLVRYSIGFEEARTYITQEAGPQLQPIKASDEEPSLKNPFDLGKAFGLFDVPLSERVDDASCAFAPGGDESKARKPLVEYLTRLVCVERLFEQSVQNATQLNGSLDVPGQCHLQEISIKRGNTPGVLLALDAFMPGFTGVSPSKARMWGWINTFAETPQLGEVAGQQVLPRGDRSPPIYTVRIARGLGSSLVIDPECDPMRDFLDEMSVSILQGYNLVAAETPILRWFLRAINGPIQAVIVFLTLWGALRLMARRTRELNIAPDFKARKSNSRAKTMKAKLLRRLRLLKKLALRWLAQKNIIRRRSANKSTSHTQSQSDLGRWVRLKKLMAARSLSRSDILQRYDNNVAEAETALLRVHREVDLIEEKWLLEIIPMVGFLGTVIGMISAMDLVGDVVSAQPGAELGVAMSKVTNALSVAFFTTFMGLVSAMLLGIWNAHQSASEVRTVRAFLHLPPPSRS